MNQTLRKIAECGQSIWYDNIRRAMLDDGSMQSLIDDGVVGVTSNPTIFQKAICESDDYDDALRELASQGRSTEQIYDALTLADIGRTADLFREVYDRTDGLDGYVSIEVNPNLAYDTDATIAEARRLFRTLDRPNVMVKIPGTDQGLPAIRTTLSEGINVNVTLIFNTQVYARIMDAYIEGATAWVKSGGDPKRIASVASFFVSRVDTAVDTLLNQQSNNSTVSSSQPTHTNEPTNPSRDREGADKENSRDREGATDSPFVDLLGQAAVANSKLAYQEFQEVFAGPRFAALKKHGVRVQRPLWASTSTKNPAYSPTLYVDTLIGPDTVNTVPHATLDAIRQGISVRQTVTDDVAGAQNVIRRLSATGIDIDEVTTDLRTAGVDAFADSFNKLIADINTRRELLAIRESSAK